MQNRGRRHVGATLVAEEAAEEADVGGWGADAELGLDDDGLDDKDEAAVAAADADGGT